MSPEQAAASSLRPPVPARRGRRWWIGVLVGWAGLVLAGITSTSLGACRRRPAAVENPTLPSQAASQGSASCRECHEEAHARWHGTDHALANREITEALDRSAFQPPESADLPGFHVEWAASGPQMVVPGVDGTHRPELVLGNKPLRQFVVPRSSGRWQPVDLAWDPAREQWFNVFGQEDRRPGEWGHWTGRGMNWNSMCAHCHMTGYRKNYDAATDAYRSTWVEQGVGCIQCHGPMAADHGRRPPERAGEPDIRATWTRDRRRAMDTCAYCHARNEPLTPEFRPGDDYHDHYRLTLPVEPGVFYPDGQQQDEDFNWTSMLLSRMHHAGVTCMDCHDPHSTRPILRVDDNSLCMQCHTAPGRTMPGTLVVTPAIDPTAHSHHQPESTGNRCVECHMPTTNYMVRAARHDHGWLKPDPLLTKELGIPNACSRCHADQSVEWAIAKADEWYGEKLDSRQRQRARAVAAAREGAERAREALLGLLAEEDIPAWRATYLQLLARWAADPAVAAAARAAVNDASPLVRSAAVQVLGANDAARDVLREQLTDPVRLVRLDAAWALADELDPASAPGRELMDYLQLAADQPLGQLRLGQYFANRGRLSEADAATARAAEWDPFSPPVFETRAQVLLMSGRLADAAAAYFRAAELLSGSGDAMFRAALAFAEAGQPRDAEAALRRAVQRDPAHDRAWYNLGLLLAQFEQLPQSADALRRAEALAPKQPEYPYALATVLARQGDRAAALAALDRCLAADPQFAPAVNLARTLGRP